MVVILNNKLFHLRKGVFSSAGHMHGYIRYLRPHYYAVFVAEIIEILRVLIVGKPQGICAQLLYYSHVLVVMSL